MNERFAIAPLGILAILILIGVLLAIFALLRNPNGRKNLLTILTFGAMVGGAMFVGIFTMRATHFRGPGMESVPQVNGSLMLLKPLLLFVGVILIVAVIRALKNKKTLPIAVLTVILLVPAVLFLWFKHGVPVAVENTQPWKTPAEPDMNLPSAPIESAHSSAKVPPVATIPLPPGYETPSIWQDSIAGQFTANVYPSKAGALKALRPKIDETLRTIAEGKPAQKVVLFASGLSATEVHSLMDSKDDDSVTWSAEPLVRNLQENEISISTNFAATDSRVDTLGNQVTLKKVKGILEVSVYPNNGKPMVLKAMVDEKPWLEDLAGFQSANPNGRFSVAKSQGTLTDEKLAEQEALTAACRTVAGVLWDMNPRRGKLLSGNLSVNATDLANRGLILDRFSQQLYGVAGPICRHALLIDLSPNKIQPLANAKFAMIAEQQKTWARILLSFVGMAAVILVVYAFLNAATRGYYAWSLRIAALVLLGVGVAIVLSLA